MKWKKLGKIFNPIDHQLTNNCIEYAQSPQALVFDDFVRIYFSTREKDKIGKYISYVSFIDIDKQFSKIIRISSETVIELGNLGCFDEHGIFPMNVLRDEDKILAYTGGWNRKVSVLVDGSIGLAFSSNNGLSFKKYGIGPVLTASLNEPFLVGDPFVAKFDNQYHMWYVYGVKWIIDPMTDRKERVYKIGYANSSDGISWNKANKQLISDRLNSEECQALPTVIRFNNKHHMFFCYRESIGFREKREKSYRIGYAHSDDNIHWTRDDDNVGIKVSDEGWDSDMLCYPHVFHCDGKIYMLYNGNEFGRFGFGLAVLENSTC